MVAADYHVLLVTPFAPTAAPCAWLRSALALLAGTELLLSLRHQFQLSEALPSLAGALACLGLTLTFIHLIRSPMRWSGHGTAAWLGAVWLALGGLRALVAVASVPAGWQLSQLIEMDDISVTSDAEVRELSFESSNAPAHLVNDVRLNFFGARGPQRDKLPLRLSATTFVTGPAALLVASSARIRVTLDGATLADLPPSGDESRIPVPAGSERRLSIWMDPTPVASAGLRAHLVSATGFARPAGPGRLASARRVLGEAWPALDALTVGAALYTLCGMLFGWLARAPSTLLIRLLIGTLVAAAVLTPRLTAWNAQHDRLLILSGGNDWLEYESFARDIRGGSPLMLEGAPLGRAAPFRFQVLYPYALALGHLVAGESAQGLILLQTCGTLMMILVVVLAAPTALGGVAGLGLTWALGTLPEWIGLAGALLSENLLLLLLALILLAIRNLPERPTWAQHTRVGALLGLAVLARATTWIAVPFLVAILARAAPDRRRTALAVILPVLAFAALVPARNVAAAHRLVVLPTEGSEIFAQGIVPAGHTITSEPWLTWRRMHDPNLVTVAEAVVNVPLGVASRLAGKMAYVLGFPHAVDPGAPMVFWPVFGLWAVAVLGVLARLRSRLAWAALTLVLGHSFAIAAVMSQPSYFYRYQLPATLPLAVWDTLAISALLPRLRLLAPERWAPAMRSAGLPGARWLGLASCLLVAGAWFRHDSNGSYPDDGSALAAFAARGVADDRLVVEDRGFPTRDYRGPAPLYVVERGAASDANLRAVLRGARHVLWLRRFTAGVEALSPAGFTLERLGRGGQEWRFHGYSLRQYDVPAQFEEPTSTLASAVDLNVGGIVRLRATAVGPSGDSHSTGGARRVVGGGRLWVALRWRSLDDSSEPLQLALTLRDSAGHTIARSVAPLFQQPDGSIMPPPRGAEVEVYRVLAIEPAVPPGTYQLCAEVSAGAEGRALSVLDAAGCSVGAGVTLAEIEIKSDPGRRVDPAELPITGRVAREAAPGLMLLGWQRADGPVAQGDVARLTLFWQAAPEPPRVPYQERLQLRQGQHLLLDTRARPLVAPGYPTDRWRPGEVLRDWLDFVVPAELPGGEHRLAIQVVQPDGASVGPSLDVGTLHVAERQRSFALPAVPHPLHAMLGDDVRFLGYNLETDRPAPGSTLSVTLYWQALGTPDASYTGFVHVLDSRGVVLSQADHLPQQGSAPTTSWVTGQVITDTYTVPLPATAPPGEYLLEVGLYQASTGRRLPVRGGPQVGDALRLGSLRVG